MRVNVSYMTGLNFGIQIIEQSMFYHVHEETFLLSNSFTLVI